MYYAHHPSSFTVLLTTFISLLSPTSSSATYPPSNPPSLHRPPSPLQPTLCSCSYVSYYSIPDPADPHNPAGDPNPRSSASSARPPTSHLTGEYVCTLSFDTLLWGPAVCADESFTDQLHAFCNGGVASTASGDERRKKTAMSTRRYNSLFPNPLQVAARTLHGQWCTILLGIMDPFCLQPALECVGAGRAEEVVCVGLVFLGVYFWLTFVHNLSFSPGFLSQDYG